MADVLNKCVKCKWRLSATEKPSKLLPCLHTLCEDCISGETDATEKRAAKEEKGDIVATVNQPSQHADVGGQTGADDEGADDKETKVNPEDGSKNGKSSEETGERRQENQQPTTERGTEETPIGPVRLKECPECKEPFSDDAIIDNVFIRKNAMVSKPGTESEHVCTGCESNAAASYCAQCDDWLCTDCVTAHKRVRMTKDHQLSSLEEATARKSTKGMKGERVASGEVDLFCQHHPKEKLSLFCEECEVLTCRDCQLLRHQEHKYHFLEDAADTYKIKLKGSVSLMKDRRCALQKCLKEIEQRLDKVNKDKVSIQQEILHQADVLVKAVRTSVWSVLSALHSFTEAASKRLSREVGDVGDLVGKFDHCINFMETILDDQGFGTSLLYSKAFVEAKCRKVYHTQMEPQSLKGQLKLQYCHDVPMVLQLLPNFGAIYINGTKYPPEKKPSKPVAGSQKRAGHSGTSAGAALPHLSASQDRSGKAKAAMNVQGHAGLGPAVSLVVPSGSSRLVTGLLPVGTQSAAWVAPPMSQNSRLMHLAVPGTKQKMVPQKASFPVMAMALQPQPVGGSVIMSAVPAAPTAPSHTTRGPATCTASVDNAHPNSGSQAATSPLSGARRAGAAIDLMPDPARPASGGGSTPDRPLSSDGAATSATLKSQHRKDKDCVITLPKFKEKRSPAVVAATLGEMQKNLDDVIRSVPLDLGDNLEPISGSDSLLEDGTMRPFITSRPSTSGAEITASSNESKVTEPIAATGTVTFTSGQPENGLNGSNGERSRSSSKVGHDAAGGADRHQVKGYSTGNSMPGFTLGLGAIDPNDDYCAACHQGGDVLCCDRCPRVFHLQCHVPILSSVPSGSFVCTLCEDDLMLEGRLEEGQGVGGKRKAPTGLSDWELKVCERVLLELFCHPSSIPFHEPVNRAVPNYYKIITNPMDFTNIKCKLSRSHFNHYATVELFLDDCKLVFNNCAVYNAETSEVGKAGKLVRQFFESLVAKHMPELVNYVKQSEISEIVESERKRRRMAVISTHASGHSEHKGK